MMARSHHPFHLSLWSSTRCIAASHWLTSIRVIRLLISHSALGAVHAPGTGCWVQHWRDGPERSFWKLFFSGENSCQLALFPGPQPHSTNHGKGRIELVLASPCARSLTCGQYRKHKGMLTVGWRNAVPDRNVSWTVSGCVYFSPITLHH